MSFSIFKKTEETKQPELKEEEIVEPVKTERFLLMEEHLKLLAGRLESEIAIRDDYWLKRAIIQQKLHALDEKEKN